MNILRPFSLTTVTHAASPCSDEECMQPNGQSYSDTQTLERPPDMQIRAFTVDQPQDILRSLSLLLVATGGWLVRHRRPATGVLQVIFEFERAAAIDMYIMLVSLGLELTANSHVVLTGFCQRTPNLTPSDSVQVATCALEIRDLADEASSPEQLYGSSAMA